MDTIGGLGNRFPVPKRLSHSSDGNARPSSFFHGFLFLCRPHACVVPFSLSQGFRCAKYKYGDSISVTFGRRLEFLVAYVLHGARCLGTVFVETERLARKPGNQGAETLSSSESVTTTTPGRVNEPARHE